MPARFASTLVATLLLLGMAEAAARLLEWWHPRVEDVSFRYAPYRMLRMEGAPWPLNAQGFRARELDAYRGTFLVEFLGGSVCLGVGTEPGLTLPERLEAALHRAGLDRAAVLNLCQGGAPSAQELAIFLEYGLPLNPEVVLSFDGANDLMHPRPVGEDDAPNLPYRDPQLKARVDAQDSLLTHSGLVRVLARVAQRSASAPALWDQAVPPRAIFDSYLYSLDAVRTLSEAHGALHAVLLQPTLHFDKPWSAEETAMWQARRPADGERVTAYVAGLYGQARDRLGHWSEDTGVPFFDLSPVFRNTRETVYSDSVHFSGERGYRTLEEQLERQGLIEKIAERYRRWEQRGPQASTWSTTRSTKRSTKRSAAWAR